jgi:catechol-2,3-dioxygenase
MRSFQVNSLSVVSLRGDDVVATAHFYRDVIGLSLLPHHGSWPTFDVGQGVHLVILKGAKLPVRDEQDVRFPVLAFSVADLEAAVENLHSHEVEMPWGIESSSSAHWVMFHDPAGNLIELAEFY